MQAWSSLLGVVGVIVVLWLVWILVEWLGGDYD